MGKRRKRTRPSVSLFPFLSILACTIGVLTLLICGSVISAQTGIDTSTIERWRSLMALMNTLTEDLADLQLKMDAKRDAQTAVDNAERRLRELRNNRERNSRNEQDMTQKMARAEAASARLPGLRADQAELQNQKKQAEKALEEVKARSASDSIQILPSGGGGRQCNPFFVECNKSGIHVFSDSPFDVSSGSVKTSSQFRRFLDMVKNTDDGMVIFLIRSKGVLTYDKVSSYVKGRNVDNGKLPLPGEGTIDLSRFK